MGKGGTGLCQNGQAEYDLFHVWLAIRIRIRKRINPLFYGPEFGLRIRMLFFYEFVLICPATF